ncbi:hypothetical protein SOPP22_03490 [Shewanella sp. OPT22]|nr:hypothetical protein SOPP22_03490 [Shewanella sp. OPT22]
MARPSMAEQRKTEILDALEACILEQGIQETSLENIAEKAGMKRTILRHYIGNRDDIICALSHRWKAKYSEQWAEAVKWLPKSNQHIALLDGLFAVGSKQAVQETIIGDELFSEARRLTQVKEDQNAIMSEFIEHFNQVLTEMYPNAKPENIELVSYGVYSSYLMSKSMVLLELVEPIHKLKHSAILLCNTLIV